MFRSRAERKVAEAGFDPSRLPPGQTMTTKWPVLQAGAVPQYDSLDAWTIRVFGEVEEEVELSWHELGELPQTTNVQDIHCVTRWSRFDLRFDGVHPRELLARARPKATARFAIAHAEAGYTANFPIEFLTADDALLATHGDGERLTPDHGYPLRLVIPGKYFWKSAKWLRGIELSAVDKPGFWERYGYHNDADPWLEQRYGF